MEEVALVTEDRWMKEEGGELDDTDREILKEASQNGQVRVRVITLREMLETMKNTEPRKYAQFKEILEAKAGKRLTFDELVELGRSADERLKEFTKLVSTMNLGQAAQIRAWRVNNHMTWRSLSRAAFREGYFARKWHPPSNQIMGIALAEKAASFFNESYRESPWN